MIGSFLNWLLREPGVKTVSHGSKLKFRKFRSAMYFVAVLVYSNDAHAILGEDDSIAGNPIIDPNLYTIVGNQPRFDDVVSFNDQVIYSNGTVSPLHSFGSGVLISPDLILTAAHNVDRLINGHVFPVPKGPDGLTHGFINGQPVSISYTVSLGPNASLTRESLTILDWEVNQGYNASAQSGPDLALVQVGSAIGLNPVTTYDRGGKPEPIQFVPLYSGSNETTQPDPNIGIAVGYGDSGGGLGGEVANTTGTKRAGLVLVNHSVSTNQDQSVLSSTFQDRGQLFKENLPSNFLEGAIAHGDSGGGLFQNIGSNGALVQTGVISGDFPGWLNFITGVATGTNNNKYGATDYYTRISDYLPWIQLTEESFQTITPTDEGSVPTNPYNPIEKFTNGVETFVFSVLANIATYIDPSGTTLEFKETTGPNITSIFLPSGFDGDLLIYDPLTNSFVFSSKIQGGVWVDFGAAGLTDFELSGLPTGQFTTGLKFASAGQVGLDLITGTQSLPSTPEPSTWTMILLGFAGLGYCAFRRKTSQRTLALSVST